MSYRGFLKNSDDIWNKYIIKFYWIIVFLNLLLSIIDLVLHKNIYTYKHILLYIVIPILFLSLNIIITQKLMEKYIKYNTYILITSSLIISVFLLIINSDIMFEEYLLLLPILIASIYYQKKYIYYATILSISTFILLFLFTPIVSRKYDIWESALILVVLIISTYLSEIIIKRGIDLLNDLDESMVEKENLIINSVMIEQNVRKDALTDFYNHKVFHQYLEELLPYVQRGFTKLQLAILDIDNFKLVNDTYGHSVGDVILKKVSMIITQSISNDDFVARYGGEEFAIIFTDRDLKDTYLILETIRKKIEEQKHEELNYQNITISIGLQEYLSNMSKEELFKGSDSSLYLAKRTGKNKIVVNKE